MKSHYKKIEHERETDILTALNQGSEMAYSYIFRLYYKDLVFFAGTFVREQATCEDIVQDVLMRVWLERKKIIPTLPIRPFLLRAIRNSCIDELRHQTIINKHRSHSVEDKKRKITNNYDTESYILYSNLRDELDNALLKIPEKYRKPFLLSRDKGMRYKDIANYLGISERMVEARISKVIGLLEDFLREFKMGYSR